MLLLVAEDYRAYTPAVLMDARIGLNFLKQIIGVASRFGGFA